MNPLIQAGRGLLCIVVLALLSVCATVNRAGAQESPHGSFKEACERCHTSTSWTTLARPMRFSHARTTFPLEGQHANIACRRCHATLVFDEAPTVCSDCHEDVHRGELGMQCERCHSPESWLVTDMPQRHAETRFPLLGAHVSAACQRCHLNQQRNEFLRVPTDCYACHSADYQATLAPAHAPAGISTDCESCHALSDPRWGGTFDHARTSFPLTGAHQAVVCAECHQGNQFRGTPTQCIDCHRDDFNAAVDPAHASGGFSTACVPCHSTTAWRPAAFDHNSSGFPLSGAHLAVPCNECHTNGRYAGTPTQCVDCHRDDFNATVDPSHTAGGFSTACVPCHSTTAWRPAAFDHNLSGFPLTGAHVTVPCVQCHADGRYAGTPAQCSGCHQQDYNQSTSPAHAAAGFPQTCETCHSTTAWRPSSYNHEPLFPIASGSKHPPGRWNACADCHTVSTNFAQFTCLTCHEHSQSRMDPKHSEVGNYRYESQSCLSCHPRGRAG